MSQPLSARVCVIALAVGSVAGCASPGVPRPPSLRLPEKAGRVEAERAGPEVRLSWTVPAKTTDGDGIEGPVIAAVCRIAAPARACVAVQRMPVAPGAATYRDVLPAGLASGAPRLLAYRVELLNQRGRSAGLSDAAYTAGGAAPAAVGALGAEARPGGVLLTWVPAETAGAAMRLTRSQAGGAVVKGGNRGGFPGKKTAAGPVTFVAEAGRPGGTYDRSAQSGETYVYTAQRVQAVTLDGHAVELRGLASAPVTVMYRDVFPPEAVTGLASIPGGGFAGPPTVELSWEASADARLVGYNVYRQEGDEAARRLTEKPVPGPAYRDFQVVAGHTYRYRVTAVDRYGNESRPSDEVRESLPR